MENKIDDSLAEVLLMKEKNQKDFEESGFDSYSEYLKNEMTRIGISSKYIVNEPREGYK